MKMSIRTRLFLGIGFLIVFFVAFSLLLNSQYLDKFYIWHKKDMLLESKKTIDGIYNGSPESITLELENLERNRGMNISILGSDYQLKYNSSFRLFNEERLQRPSGAPGADFRRRLADRRSPLFLPIEQQLGTLAEGDSITDIVKDPRLKTNFLVLASRLSNGEILVLSTPLAAINESAAIANRFFMFTGIITIILGGIAVFLFAREFTKPILDLNDIAQRMSKLDFSKKYTVQSEDEVGQLGKSINSLSLQLDKAISELTEANDKLKEDIQRERRIDKMRKQFVSNVSHELKTPIALIQGYAEGLKLNVNENEADRDFYCDVIMDEADKMNRLVRDLLDLSQIESGYFKLEKTVFDISYLVDQVLEKYRPILTEKGIKVEVEKNDNIDVCGDVTRIEQVLVNYLNNAINHVEDKNEIRLAVTRQSNKVRVSVFNFGQPIPEESLNKLWTSFYKVDKARTRAYGGTGLGLSVVRAIQELHNNAYGVENRDNGVLFWFEADDAVVLNEDRS
ncbi:MAG TPA: HAMP domain-containing sensor histidine kinase [Desulfobacteria bacterium]|nr:HAMP domain-containing sensor histidine kinase [Desulfobacteria bacterium]